MAIRFAAKTPSYGERVVPSINDKKMVPLPYIQEALPNALPNYNAMRQARWRAAHVEEHRAYMREYMRSRRIKKVSDG